MEKVNKSQLAKILGVTKQRIGQLAKTNKLKFGADGKIDIEEAKRQIENTKERVKATDRDGEDFSGESETLIFYKTKTANFESQLKEIEVKRKNGELLNAEDVKRDANIIGRKLHDSLLSIPERISNILAVEVDALIIRNLLLAEIKATLNQISDDLQGVK
jgi:phage terminase Nu1 subunit (DNA packaging protein)